MDCVILAGGIPGPADPLYALTQGKPKALLQIGRFTLLEHVIEALTAANSVGEIVVVGIEPVEVPTIRFPIQILPNEGSMIANVLAGAKWLMRNGDHKGHAVFTSSDIPAVTSVIIDHFIASCEPFIKAAYYSFVTRETMEAQFPGSERTFVKLGDSYLSGGNLIVARPDLVEKNRELLHALSGGRKHAWKMARTAGPKTLLRFLTRRLKISDIEQRAEEVFGYPVQMVDSPNAEIAMDIDKPVHLSILRQYMAAGKAYDQ